MPRFDLVSNDNTSAQTGPSAQDTWHLQVPTFLISTHPTLDTYKSTHSPNHKLGVGVPQNILSTGSLKWSKDAKTKEK